MTSSVTVLLSLIEIFVTYKILVFYACSCENFAFLLASLMFVLMFSYSM